MATPDAASRAGHVWSPGVACVGVFDSPGTVTPLPGAGALQLLETTRRRLYYHRRLLFVLSLVATLLVGVNVADKFGPVHTGIFLEPVAAVALIGLARWHGLSWHDLGLARRTWSRGARYAIIAIATVAVVYGLGTALPLTRDAFADSRYQLGAGTALVTSFVLIPLGTVLLEEVAFRGVLLGLLRRRKTVTLAVSVSSVTFGLWHILPSLAMGANQLVAGVVGQGVLARAAMVLGVVAFTGLAGWLLCEIRHRSGSLLAPVGLHWATNGLGVLLVSAMWSLKLA